MRYWCVSTSPENWLIGKRHMLWGMDGRYFVTLEKYVGDGDLAIVYSEGAFLAAIQFVGRYFYDLTSLGWKRGDKKYPFPYRLHFEMVKESISPPRIFHSTEEEELRANWSKPNLIDDIVFLADKGKTCNQFLEESIVLIPKEDYETILQRL